jgi:hypothetical protein
MAMAAKLAYFAIERVTEPVSTFIGTIAERSPGFQAGCRSLARRVGNAGLYPDYTHAGLTDEQAAKAGAEILGEGVVWSVGLAVLAHQTLLETTEEREQDRRLAAFERRIHELEYELAKANGAVHVRRLVKRQSGVDVMAEQPSQERDPASRTADGWRGRLADALGLRGRLPS